MNKKIKYFLWLLYESGHSWKLTREQTPVKKWDGLSTEYVLRFWKYHDKTKQETIDELKENNNEFHHKWGFWYVVRVKDFETYNSDIGMKSEFASFSSEMKVLLFLVDYFEKNNLSY